MTCGLVFITLVLFIRYGSSLPFFFGNFDWLSTRSAIYRSIELVDGWNGRIIATEVYFSAYFCVLSFDSYTDPLRIRRPRRSHGGSGNIYAPHHASWNLTGPRTTRVHERSVIWWPYLPGVTPMLGLFCNTFNDAMFTKSWNALLFAFNMWKGSTCETFQFMLLCALWGPPKKYQANSNRHDYLL